MMYHYDERVYCHVNGTGPLKEHRKKRKLRNIILCNIVVNTCIIIIHAIPYIIYPY